MTNGPGGPYLTLAVVLDLSLVIPCDPCDLLKVHLVLASPKLFVLFNNLSYIYYYTFTKLVALVLAASAYLKLKYVFK